MTIAIVKVITPGHNALYYTGQAGAAWISENMADAFEYSVQGAARKVEELKKTYASIGLRFDTAEKPNDVYFALLDNCGDEIGGRQAKGGLSGALRRQIADDLAAKYNRRQGEGFVQVRDTKTWEVVEKMELPA